MLFKSTISNRNKMGCTNRKCSAEFVTMIRSGVLIWLEVVKRTWRTACLYTCGAVLVPAMLGVPASAQGLTNLISGHESAAQQAKSDSLKRDTPRDSIYNLLQACHSGNFLLASQYLDLRAIKADERATLGPTLAKDLCDFLDRDSRFE